MATAKHECDIFTCPICLEKLKSAKILPCSHSFCEVCIGEFILSTERQTGHKLKSYPCPVCRAVVTHTKSEEETAQWALSLPTNVTISAQMNQSESTKQECHLCKTENIQNVATHWCRDCSDTFCDDCLRIHNRMKISADHKVLKIDKISKCASDGEPIFGLISDKCSVHTSKILEAFCFDHEELCCLLCLTVRHRKCENVQAFEMTNLDTDRFNSLESELNKVKVKVEQIIEEKKNGFKTLDSSFKSVELAAISSAASIKDRVDILLSSFLKELNISLDEQKAVFEGKLKTAENLLSCVISMMNTTKSVQDYGSMNQKFIHLFRTKPELKSKIMETSKVLNEESVEEGRFVIDNTIQQVEKADRFGKIKVYCNLPIAANCSAPINLNEFIIINSVDTGTVQNIKLKHKKTMFYTCKVKALCMMDKLILVGGIVGRIGPLYAFDCVTGTCTAEMTCETGIKRLTCDMESRTIFVLCNDSDILLTFKLERGKFESQHEIKTGTLNNGGLCVFDEFIYIIVGKELHKIKIVGREMIFKKILTTNTCRYRSGKSNGFSTDIKNKRLLYTSYFGEVVAITPDGCEIFCYKDEHMKNIVSVAVNNHGCIIACDQSCALHVISEDGTRRKTLLDRFDKINAPNDICFDNSGKVLFVCGDNFLEEYEVFY